MDPFYDVIASTSFRNAMYSLSLVSIVLAIGITVIAFAYYGRAREADATGAKDTKWILLFATWRDSLIVTLLYTAESLLYRYMDFNGLTQVNGYAYSSFSSVVVPIASFTLEVLIFVVVALRIIAITRWLSWQAKAGRGA